MYRLLLLLLFPLTAFGQNFSFLQQVAEEYDSFSERTITTRRFKHSDIEPLLLGLDKSLFDVQKAGESVEGRSIYLVKAGHGPVKVLLWSQMHGDETTATRALLDLFNFLSEKKPFKKEKRALLDQLSLYFIPMLNPDGAGQFERRNALGIDINRDALRLQSPEAQLLKQACDSIRPHFGFNLHDQSPYTSAGSSGKPATLSFLAPAYNPEKEVNDVRQRAMQLVVLLDSLAQKYIPGHTGRYDDTFEPRAFGDNIQKWGVSTVLIECGGYPGDREKQFIRKVHFLALLGTLQSIASGSYAQINPERYFAIPENSRRHFDLLVKNGQVERKGNWRTLDLGIRLHEITGPDLRRFDLSGMVEDAGDLAGFYGYEEIDAAGMQLKPAKVYPKVFANIESIPAGQAAELLAQGYGYLQLKELPQERFTQLPFVLIAEGAAVDAMVGYGSPATFIAEENGEVKYTVVNGMVYDVAKQRNGIRNGVLGGK